MRYTVAIEVQTGQYESHIFDSPEHFASWYSAQARPGIAINRASVGMLGGIVLAEVDHRARTENLDEAKRKAGVKV